MQAIDRFVGEYRWLSNFHPSHVRYDDVEFPTVEHAYQFAKTLDPKDRAVIRGCTSPGRAQRTGRLVHMRPDWERIKEDVMLDLLRQKFRQPTFRTLLDATGIAYIEEGNDWGDTFWGTCNGIGENRLGILIMLIRDENRRLFPHARRDT